MKESVRREWLFLFFDQPLNIDAIHLQFANVHRQQQLELPYWSLAATRKKIIASFWFRKVPLHYGCLLFLSILLSICITGQGFSFITPLIFAGIITALTLLPVFYWPMYFSQFLPALDNIIAEQEKLQISNEETKKCKRTQFSIPTLVVIYFVFSKTSDLPLLPANDQAASLLNNLFGADKDKLKQNLSRLLKISELSPKERAEIVKGISAARDFFETLGSKSAGAILNHLEIKVNRS